MLVLNPVAIRDHVESEEVAIHVDRRLSLAVKNELMPPLTRHQFCDRLWRADASVKCDIALLLAQDDLPLFSLVILSFPRLVAL